MANAMLLGAILGLTSHLAYFVHGEHDNLAGPYAWLACASPFMIFSLALLTGPSQWLQAALTTLSLHFSFYCTLFTSIAIYRLFLHPLRHLPGPTATKLSKLTHLWAIRGFRNYQFLDGIHNVYGDAVRTGPNEITFFTPTAFETIYGSRSRFQRSVFFEGLRPLRSVIAARDLKSHAQLRKAWDKALSPKALEKMSLTIRNKLSLLVQSLEMATAQPVNISEYIEKFSVDVVGLLGFSHDFNLITEPDFALMAKLNAGRASLGYSAPVPWLKKAAVVLPQVRKGYDNLVAWANSLIEPRLSGLDNSSKSLTGDHTGITKKAHHDDVLSYIMKDVAATGTYNENRSRLLGEMILFISAGVDPPASCLIHMLYHLAGSATCMRQVRRELDQCSDHLDPTLLKQLPHFNAVINEVLRLHTPVPSGGLRTTPRGGAMIDGLFVREGTTVLVPKHTLFRRDDCFVRPNEFIPERFTTKPELILKQVFAPFSLGEFDCAGRKLALMQIRLAAAALINAFDIAYAPGYDANLAVSSTRDCFTTVAGPLHLILTKRGKSSVSA